MDVVVTVPKHLWAYWLEEGDLPGESAGATSYHFWFRGGVPAIKPGERVYIVAHGRLRGYAPLVQVEQRCILRPRELGVSCFERRGGAVAVTILEPVRGFQGWRYRWWEREQETPFPDWRTP